RDRTRDPAQERRDYRREPLHGWPPVWSSAMVRLRVKKRRAESFAGSAAASSRGLDTCLTVTASAFSRPPASARGFRSRPSRHGARAAWSTAAYNRGPERKAFLAQRSHLNYESLR